MHGSCDNISSFIRIENLLLPSIQTICHGVQDISKITDAVLPTIKRQGKEIIIVFLLKCVNIRSVLRTSNVPNGIVRDFLNLIKSFKKNLHNEFDLFQHLQHSDEIRRSSYDFEMDCSKVDLNSRIIEVFDLMRTEIFSITKREFSESRNIMLYSGVTHFLNGEDTCNTEIEDVKRSRIEEIMHETLHIIVQNVLLALQGCKKGELSMKRKSLNFAKRIEEVLLLQFPRENNQAMLYLRQSVLLHIQVFINSQLFGSETYYKVIHEVVYYQFLLVRILTILKGIQNILQTHDKNISKLHMFMKPTDILNILHDSYVQGMKIFLGEILQRVRKVSEDVTIYILSSQSKYVSELIFELLRPYFIFIDQ